LRGHDGDPPGSVLGLRLLGAVHRLVLEGRLPELAREYSRPDPDPAEVWRLFAEALSEHAGALRPLIERTVQTNEVGRSAALLPGFLRIAQHTGLPLRLLEVGCSAGLNLRWDRYRYEAGDFAWGPCDSPLRLGFALSGLAAGERADLRLTIWPGGEQLHLARVSYHGDSVELRAC
jgi:hypothetical protein